MVHVCGWKDRCRDGNLRTYCHVSPILFGWFFVEASPTCFCIFVKCFFCNLCRDGMGKKWRPHITRIKSYVQNSALDAVINFGKPYQSLPSAAYARAGLSNWFCPSLSSLSVIKKIEKTV